LGIGLLLQPAFSAASSSTAFMRGSCSSSLRRNVKGSTPAACATSSMNASTAKVVCELPTTRHHSTGTPVLWWTIRRDVGNRIGDGRGALDRGRIDAVLDHRGKRPAGHDRLADDDVPPAGEFTLVGFRPASSLWKYMGRYRPPWMSSSRVHCSLIGVPSAP
jgi:hypothetical protein